MKQISNILATMFIYFARVLVLMYFIHMYQQFGGLYDRYYNNMRPNASAVQATQLSNEANLIALSYIGQLLVVIAAILVFEAMYRNRQRQITATN